jgi:hypothetical protein
MAYTKYSLTPANNTATPPDGAPEGMLPSAVNDTMRDMMAQIRDVGDGIRDGTYTMTAAKITGGTITGATVTSNTFSSSGATITGGTINSTAIGGTTAAAGAFTTLSATGNVSFDGGSFVFNEAGADKDARFEGDTDANLLFLDASTDRIGIGTSSPGAKLHIVSADGGSTTGLTVQKSGQNFFQFYAATNNTDGVVACAGAIRFENGSGSERMRIRSDGHVGIATTSILLGYGDQKFSCDGTGVFQKSGNTVLAVNRLTNDGTLVAFWQADVQEGDISVSGTTVSYNGGHLSRWAQTTAPKDDTLLKGTVLSNLDEMNEYVDKDGNTVDNEQLNKVKVSDVEGDVNVAGVFVNWSHDEQHNVDEINMAMTGDMIIRIAQGVVIQKGDLLMSAGDGTAKPQGDDIVRSKTIAKVTSNHVTCTYADGSYCVPCVLMAC